MARSWVAFLRGVYLGREGAPDEFARKSVGKIYAIREPVSEVAGNSTEVFQKLAKK